MEYCIVFLPLLGFLTSVVLVNYQSTPEHLQHTLKTTVFIFTCGCMLIAALASCYLFYLHIFGGLNDTLKILPWITINDLQLYWSLRFDGLSIVMITIVNVVSFCVHWYSVGYMHEDPHGERFMGYLSLFTFSMLLLITADNFAQLFLGWEAVGLASYLLIGFWYERPSANAAAIKAFVVNRVGDVGLCLGIAAVFLTFNSLQFDQVFTAVPNHVNDQFHSMGWSVSALTIICGLLFLGAMGKSAQFGLHVWLPDAMEGPTPVSALIHAATMVTAGVFMVARTWPLFEQAPLILEIMMVLGALTAFFAATVAITQSDIKRIIAYSTCSQLGYMFMASGASAYHSAVFHLFTHAFFKALLFLGAGSVIHSMSGEQNIHHMGGLRRLIPTTYGFLWIGTLALIGCPFLAGYYSKDLILESLWLKGTVMSISCFYLGLGVAFLTAFYSGRLLFLTFHGKPRANEKVLAHVHESPLSMLIPLSILSMGALFAGYGFHEMFQDQHFWGKSIGLNPVVPEMPLPFLVHYSPLIAATSGLSLAVVLYCFKTDWTEKIVKAFSTLQRFLINQWYINELYDQIIVAPLKKIARTCADVLDPHVIDKGIPLGIAKIAASCSSLLSRLQTGYIYHYILIFLSGILSIFIFSIYFY